MGVRDEHDIHGRKVAQVETGLAEPLQNEKPTCEVGIYDDVHSSHLEEKAGVSNESDAQLAALNELRFMGASGARRDGRMANEAGEAAGSFAKGRIL